MSLMLVDSTFTLHLSCTMAPSMGGHEHKPASFPHVTDHSNPPVPGSDKSFFLGTDPLSPSQPWPQNRTEGAINDPPHDLDDVLSRPSPPFLYSLSHSLQAEDTVNFAARGNSTTAPRIPFSDWLGLLCSIISTPTDASLSTQEISLADHTSIALTPVALAALVHETSNMVPVDRYQETPDTESPWCFQYTASHAVNIASCREEDEMEVESHLI
jgi:hypothetical protein